MFTFDLKSGYHHIEIYHEHQTYLGFAWNFGTEKTVRYYKFTALPFGLSTAPYIFTKMLKPLQKHWRCQGICLALFLDDGWVNGSDLSTCKSDSDIVKNDLDNAGFGANQEKSVWEPTQICSWSGLVWHSKDGTLEVSERRIEKITETVQPTMDSNFTVSARAVASFTGQIISTGPVIGNIRRNKDRGMGGLWDPVPPHFSEKTKMCPFFSAKMPFFESLNVPFLE